MWSSSRARRRAPRRADRSRASESGAQRGQPGDREAAQRGSGHLPRQAQVREIGERITSLDERAKELDERFREMLAGIPNVPHESVPAGKSERRQRRSAHVWASPERSTFEPKAHWDLGPELWTFSISSARRRSPERDLPCISGSGRKLERALINFMLDTHTGEHGYTEILPPFLINSASLFGTGQLPKFAEDLFKCENTDFWLAPTAEVPVTNLFRDETLDGDKLPIKLCAYTPCFRSEAGSYGRDVRGIIRQHQFQKVELVKFARPDQSYDELEKLTGDAEHILQKLGLPYRTVVLCTGDMGFSSAKTYDIEVWLPGQNGL